MKFKIFSTLLALALLVPAVAGASENSKSNDEEYHKDSPYVNADGEYDIEAHRSQRGLVKLDNAVVPKGQWIIGANASYSNHINKDYTLAIVNGISSTGYSIDVSPIIAYTIKSNMSVGVRFAYSRSLLNLDSAMLSICDEDTAVEIEADD